MSSSADFATPRTSPIIARVVGALIAMLFATCLSGCGAINRVPTLEEQAKSSWSEVQNQYQRRADLIPNLVETVKGFAQQEREVLTQVVEARAKATQTSVNVDPTDPEACLLYTSPSPRDGLLSRMPSSA